MFRLLKFGLSDRYPAVSRLAVHEENNQTVFLWDDGDVATQLASEKATSTTLTEYFRLNREDGVGFCGVKSRDVLYKDIPKHFRMVGSKFVARKNKAEIVTRVDYASPRDGERFYIRLLLSHVKGSTSWEDLRTVSGKLYQTYREAADALGLLESDEHFDKCLAEAALWMTGSALRELFAMIIVHNVPSDSLSLWATHKTSLQDDCAHHLLQLGVKRPLTESELDNYCLYLIRLLLEGMGRTMNQGGLHIYDKTIALQVLNLISEADTSVEDDRYKSKVIVMDQIPLLNLEQRSIFSSIRDEFNQGIQSLKYIDGPGGTGKTFLLNTMLHYFNSRGVKFVAVASSGVAAQLLLQGTTAHSAFGIPLTLTRDSMCNLNGRDAMSKRLRDADVIVWDEVSMQHRYAIESVDKSLRHLKQRDIPLGGASVYFSGDFRQTLPIVPNADFTAQAYVCLKWSPLWELIRSYKLEQNVRLLGTRSSANTSASLFASWLLKLGSGHLQDHDRGTINLDHVKVNYVQSGSSIDMFTVYWLYDNFNSVINSEDWTHISRYFADRCLITPLNNTAEEVNQIMNEKIGGDFMLSTSMDFVEEEEGEPLAEEFLNSIELPGFSRHQLMIRRGVPMMVIRNLNLAQGVCNGTRVVVTDFSDRVLKCRLVTGARSGQDILIPKIKLIHEGNSLAPIKFSRFQFPLVDAFCMTINKSQGQTLNKVAVLLPNGVFGHGQLYVALSRCRSLDNILVSLANSTNKPETTNVVLKHVLHK